MSDEIPLPIALLISGGGTTMVNLARHISEGRLDARIVAVVASNSRSAGIARAEELGFSHHVVERKTFDSVERFSGHIFDIVRQAGARLVCLGGFLSLLRIPEDYVGRVINIHPALLPAFGGKGMYGHHVHKAVLAHGCKVSGCTVHFADEHYDHGPIIAQRAVPVMEDDTPQSLAERVFGQECEVYPQVVQWFAEGRLKIDGRLVRVLSAKP
jgi:formyltetrahydrofolate-dependent phosphoribosylglycinamide formyltransferase